MASQSCDTCVRLWREYGNTTRSHVELLKELERVAGVDPQRFRELDGEIELAAARRDAARSAVKLHLAEHGEASESRTMTA
jgi:hypothetical protein